LWCRSIGIWFYTVNPTLDLIQIFTHRMPVIKSQKSLDEQKNQTAMSCYLGFGQLYYLLQWINYWIGHLEDTITHDGFVEWQFMIAFWNQRFLSLLQFFSLFSMVAWIVFSTYSRSIRCQTHRSLNQDLVTRSKIEWLQFAVWMLWSSI
jgi:hypothetical protein